MFDKRRRDRGEQPPGEQPAREQVADSPPPPADSVDAVAAPTYRPVDESLLPRWRRPSVQQARRADPLRNVEGDHSLSFDATGVKPLGQYERRTIRYRLVRLLDSPDEVRASEIGLIDRGDEVQLLERYGVYWRVLCPDGRQGWVHRMTLAEPRDQVPSGKAGAPEAAEPYAPEPDASAPETSAPETSAPETSAPEADEQEAAALEAEEEGEFQGASEMDFAPPDPSVDGLLEAYIRARSEGVEGVEPAAEVVAGPVEAAAVQPVEDAVDGGDADAAPEPVEVEPAGQSEPEVNPAAETLEAAGEPETAEAEEAAQEPEAEEAAQEPEAEEAAQEPETAEAAEAAQEPQAAEAAQEPEAEPETAEAEEAAQEPEAEEAAEPAQEAEAEPETAEAAPEPEPEPDAAAPEAAAAAEPAPKPEAEPADKAEPGEPAEIAAAVAEPAAAPPAVEDAPARPVIEPAPTIGPLLVALVREGLDKTGYYGGSAPNVAAIALSRESGQEAAGGSAAEPS